MSEIQDRSRRPAVRPGHRPAGLMPAYRAVPMVLVAGLVAAGLTLATIGSRSPYTHSNLNAGYDPGYERTTQALLGQETALAHADGGPIAGDANARGAVLFVRAGCASCHALAGRGGIVGPRLAGLDAATIAQRVRQGPVGMPPFPAGALSDGDVSAIAAYLRSLPAD